MKKNKGITLVALIITIIVMLILVGVSISVLINSDLIGTAQNAADRTETAYEQEGNMSSITIGNTTYNSIDEYLAAQGGNAGGGNENPPSGNTMPAITAGQKATVNSTYSDGTDTAIIPAGFTVSGVSTEQTIAGGLVIYLIPEGKTVLWSDGTEVATAQKTYDQFVWIPIKNTTTDGVEDINDMYICQNKGTGSYTEECVITVPEATGVATCTEHGDCTAMAGYLYTDTAMTTKVSKYDTSSRREPDTVSDYDSNSTYLGYLSSILEPDATEKEYTTKAKFETKLQEEYNDVVKSVYENQGFYVGRYETSGMAQVTSGYDVAVVAGVLPSVETDWYHMYAQQKKYASDNSLTVGSTMIQGAAYDQVMKFVDTDSYDVTTAGEVGHNFSSRYNTGSQSTDVSKNIFDLEGNVRAWTTEASGTKSRVDKGR